METETETETGTGWGVEGSMKYGVRSTEYGERKREGREGGCRRMQCGMGVGMGM